MDISISLISVNQRSDLERLLPSLSEAVKSVSSEILLVDNRSADGSGNFVRQAYPEINVMENPRITGYGENHNLN